jgi:hypothetical protein
MEFWAQNVIKICLLRQIRSLINEATGCGLDGWKFYLISMSISALEPLSLLSNGY